MFFMIFSMKNRDFERFGWGHAGIIFQLPRGACEPNKSTLGFQKLASEDMGFHFPATTSGPDQKSRKKKVVGLSPRVIRLFI